MFFSFSYDPYIAVIGDIKNSRNIKNRGEVQKKLNGVLEEVNERYAEDLSSKFVDVYKRQIWCSVYGHSTGWKRRWRRAAAEASP